MALDYRRLCRVGEGASIINASGIAYWLIYLPRLTYDMALVLTGARIWFVSLLSVLFSSCHNRCVKSLLSNVRLIHSYLSFAIEIRRGIGVTKLRDLLESQEGKESV